MRSLYHNLTQEEIEAYGLVLSAAGLTHIRIHTGNGRWSLWVETAALSAAQRLIERYREENLEALPHADESPPAPSKNISAVWVCLALSASFLAAGGEGATAPVAAAFGAAAEKILAGEVYRLATALMLHASIAHLAGNLAGIALFGTAVCSIAGTGAGWLMILLSGLLGNAASAVLVHSDHISIGASTAVFGAVGWMAAYQFRQKAETRDRRIKAWLPLAGGLALLGFLGTGPHSDLSAHFFGFASGILLGLAYTRFRKGPVDEKGQFLCLVTAVGLISGAWVWARTVS